MKKLLPYILIATAFALFIGVWHREVLTYRFDQETVRNYLRSQDIEDPNEKIKDRIWVSDNDIYISAGYLYAKGESPTKYNFQHPPLVKYLFGLSIILTGNPFYVQIGFGLAILFLTYFLGTKLFKNPFISFAGTMLLLTDPVFGGMMNEALLDLGQAVFAIGYLILAFFYPGAWLFQGVFLGLFAASKFWSTAVIFVGLIYFYKLVIRKEKVNDKKTVLSFVAALIVFSLTYLKDFIDARGPFNIFAFLAKDLRFMLDHNSASAIGGPIALFVSGYFLPWWQGGIARAADWNILWPIGLIASLILVFKTNIKDIKFFFFVLPIIYLLLSSTQVPFTRYFILILPIIYLNLSNLLVGLVRK